jgi:hypothetical protein
MTGWQYITCEKGSFEYEGRYLPRGEFFDQARVELWKLQYFEARLLPESTRRFSQSGLVDVLREFVRL